MSVSFQRYSLLSLFSIILLAVMLSGCRTTSSPGKNRPWLIKADAREASILLLDKRNTEARYKIKVKYQRNNETQTIEKWHTSFIINVAGKKKNITNVHATVYKADGVTVQGKKDVHLRRSSSSVTELYLSSLQLPVCATRDKACAHVFIVEVKLNDQQVDNINFVQELTADENVYMSVKSIISLRNKCYMNLVCVAPKKSDLVQPMAEITRI